jgi:hypothetical protein
MSVDAFLHSLDRLSTSGTSAAHFADFCELTYCAYARFTAPAPQRADALHLRALAVAERSTAPTILAYDALRDQAQQIVRQGGIDLLGSAAERLQILDKQVGEQRFTPWEIAQFMAAGTIAQEGVQKSLRDSGYFKLIEPACGAGAMVLACADILEQDGQTVDQAMLVRAVDIDRLAYQMCYLQLTWRGVAALVIHGDTRAGEEYESAYTYAASRFFLRYGHLVFAHERVCKPSAPVAQSKIGSPAPEAAP